MKNIKYRQILLVVLITEFLILATVWGLSKTPTDNFCKNYIIEHQDEIVLTEGIKWQSDTETLHFTIPTVEGYYWGDVSIRYYNDHRYDVIFWADREKMKDKELLWKFLWFFKLDKDFDVNVNYLDSKGESVEKDKLILNILKNYKHGK